MLALLTFFFFGAAIAGPALGEVHWQIVAYALVSLTAVRLLPVAVALLGTRFRGPSVLFLGWFGPRGLASILFGLFVLEEANLPMADEMFLVVTITVLLSVFAHGLSAVPAAGRFGEWFSEHIAGPLAVGASVEELPTR